ncbi:MAG: hypothetical protein IJW09_01295 [Clostridia bacterium]|nr:hypothetical protein [Clostridia bacterium]
MRVRCAAGCHFFVIPQRNGERKGTKGSNTPWIPAKLVSLAIFWWLPKGVVASAIFAQRNPKISLLLQAGYHFLLHSVPRCKEKNKKNIRVYTASHAALPSRAVGGERKSFFFLGRGWRLDSPFWWQAGKAKAFL